MLLLLLLATVCATHPSFRTQGLPVAAENPESLIDAEEGLVYGAGHTTDRERSKRAVSHRLFCIPLPISYRLYVVFSIVYRITTAAKLQLTYDYYYPVTPPTKGDKTFYRCDDRYDYYVYLMDERYHITVNNKTTGMAVVNFVSSNTASYPEEAVFSVASLVQVGLLVFLHPHVHSATGVYQFKGQSYNQYAVYQLRDRAAAVIYSIYRETSGSWVLYMHDEYPLGNKSCLARSAVRDTPFTTSWAMLV